MNIAKVEARRRALEHYIRLYSRFLQMGDDVMSEETKALIFTLTLRTDDGCVELRPHFDEMFPVMRDFIEEKIEQAKDELEDINKTLEVVGRLFSHLDLDLE